MQFKEIVGHQGIKQQLLHTVKANRVSHAQLFLGPEGSGSLALAIAYAQYINCENRQESDSCGQCSSCRKYEKYIHPDLHFSFPFFAKKDAPVSSFFLPAWREALLENSYMGYHAWRNRIEGENKQANINIAEIHDILKKLSLKSFEAEYKVLIMWLPEYMGNEGNALLKLIEEPPEKTLFLLVAESQDKILNTIISRTQLVKVPKLSIDDVQEYLVTHRNVDPLKAREIAFIADGNMQAALDTLQQDSNPHFELFISWLRAIVTDSGLRIVAICEDNLSRLGRENQKNFLLYGINTLRQIVVQQQGLNNLVFLQDKELEFITKFSQIYTVEQLAAAVDLFEKAHYAIERNANPKILFLDVSLQLVLLFKYNTFPKSRDSIYI